MKYEYQIQVKEYKGDKWFAIGHTLESLLMCRRKVDELKELYNDHEEKLLAGREAVNDAQDHTLHLIVVKKI